MIDNKVYVVGAGLAGLSASVALAEKGADVELIESSRQAGGRCRSYFDTALGTIIDNGNHLVLSGNHATMAYLHTFGGEKCLAGPERAETSFMDLATGKRWTIAPSEGPLPFWLFDRNRRVPDTGFADYLQLLALFTARREQTIGDVLDCRGPLWDRLLQPFFLAALNTQPDIASASLAANLVRETLARGGRAYRMRLARPNLGAAFVDPAVQFIFGAGGRIAFGERLKAITFDGAHAASLTTSERTIALAGARAVILATPPWIVSELVPQIPVPDVFNAIVNGHFRTAPPAGAPPMLGLLGGTAEWVFSFPDRISVTVSAADRLVDLPREELAAQLWNDVAKALGIVADMPEWQIVKEKRATFAATPAQARRRPKARTGWNNLLLAGDWTDTGLPATIEGAIRSGRKAAELALAGGSL